MTPRTNYSKWWQFQNWWVVDVGANIRMFTHSISIIFLLGLYFYAVIVAKKMHWIFPGSMKTNEKLKEMRWCAVTGDENLTFCVHLGSLLLCFSLERWHLWHFFAQLCTLNIIKRGSLFMWDLILCWVDTFSGDSSTRSKKCQSSSIAKSQLPNFFLPSW